jgi:hypothetical protein
MSEVFEYLATVDGVMAASVALIWVLLGGAVVSLVAALAGD